MEPSSSWSSQCICGRGFSSPQAITNHRRSCAATKKRRNDTLERGKDSDVLRSKKRRKTQIETLSGAAPTAGPSGVASASTQASELRRMVNEVPEVPTLTVETGEAQTQPLGRGCRQNRLPPVRYRNILPDPPAALPPPAQSTSATSTSEFGHASSSSPSSMPVSSEPVASNHGSNPPAPKTRTILKSMANKFGLYRQYCTIKFPEHDPNANLSFDDLIDTSHSLSTDLVQSYGIYPNLSSLLLGEWYWSRGVKKSISDFDALLKIVGHPEFRPEDVAGTKWKRINAILGGSGSGSVGSHESVLAKGEDADDEDSWEDCDDAGWRQTPVTIEVPFHKNTFHPGRQQFTAGILHHRSLIAVIREKIMKASSFRHLHFEPYQLYWEPAPGCEPMRVHGEVYTSDAFIDAHNEIQDSPGEPGCDLARVVFAMMFASDATQLTAFGTAQLSPVYLACGNESKERRNKPSYDAFDHVAYFEKLPDNFKDFAVKGIGRTGPDSILMAHCTREIFHAQWDILLDKEFLDAYVHGVVIACIDGVRRRFFPRIFAYSADYPEKVTIACIRNLGLCPCPRCRIPLARAHNVGMKRDMSQRKSLARIDNDQLRDNVARARTFIYEKNYAIKSVAVENLLSTDSYVPTANAFSSKLGPQGFQIFSVLVVDLMHEIEIGVWKALFIHLLRLLDCQDEKLKHELDRRFRQIPPFGVDGIRKIYSNRSELKKMTAHDYEDMLQCAIPVFDGLLPEPHNTRILKLLFTLAHWHGLAKLRMHTEQTLVILSEVTASLGASLREFKKKTCSKYDTRELQRESDARQRRDQKKAANSGNLQTTSKTPNSNSRNSKEYNLDTYKVHSLGDYAVTIAHLGTTDSYSTQRSELEHRKAKARFLRTSGRSIPLQLARIERRQANIQAIRERLQRGGSSSSRPQHAQDLIDNDLRAPYNMGKTENFPLHIPIFLQSNKNDPAIKSFHEQLTAHLLPRIQELIRAEVAASSAESEKHSRPVSSVGVPGSFSPALSAPGRDASNFIFFKNDRIFQHKLSRFNFTTYDVRRSADIIKPETTRRNIMLVSDDHVVSDGEGDPQHFLYARVLGAYHAQVIYTGPGMLDYKPRRLDFLWVRWYEVMDTTQTGWKNSKLDKVRFPPIDSENAFGFVDPHDVLRSCHIIPAFKEGMCYSDGVGLSKCAKDADDYNEYYVGRFSDRDLLMRYHWGLGVGHVHAHRPRNVGASAIVPTYGHTPGVDEAEDCEELQPELTITGHNPSLPDDSYKSDDDPEYGLEDRDKEGWDDEDVGEASENVNGDREIESEDE